MSIAALRASLIASSMHEVKSLRDWKASPSPELQSSASGTSALEFASINLVTRALYESVGEATRPNSVKLWKSYDAAARSPLRRWLRGDAALLYSLFVVLSRFSLSGI